MLFLGKKLGLFLEHGKDHAAKVVDCGWQKNIACITWAVRITWD
jgi:hypothetical protein